MEIIYVYFNSGFRTVRYLSADKAEEIINNLLNNPYIAILERVGFVDEYDKIHYYKLK